MEAKAMNTAFRLDAIARALAGMSPTRKVIAGAIVVALIAGGAWLFQRGNSIAAGSAMEPVLDQPFAETDLIQIKQHLDEKHVPNELRDGKVYVPADRKLAVLSDLFYSDVLSGVGTDAGFDALVKQMSAWDPPSKTDKLFNKFRESTDRNVIGHFKGVRRATVIIDPTSERHIGGSIQPTAMVDIQTQRNASDANPRQLANAAVNAVTGAVANLSRDRVKVTIDGAAWSAGSAEFIASDLLARRQACEQAYCAKVRQLLAYIPDVLVSVSVDSEPAAQPGAQTSPAAGSAVSADDQPTVVVNAVPMIAQLSAPPAARAVAGKNSSSASSIASIEQRARSASVAIPRSYFVQIFRRANRKPDGTTDPDDGMLQPIVDAQSEKIRSLVKNALGLTEDSNVTVEPYEDAAGPIATSAARTAAKLPPPSAVASAPVVTLTPVTAGSPMFSLGGHAREAALIGAGVVGMLLLSALFRRARPMLSTGHELPTFDDSRARDLLLDDSEADEMEDELTTDEQAHRIFRRVRDVVGENPEQAARVLRGWIYQEQ
jgi:flagellar biosynthesis/type III secretory pathway M-ring protein FliF/YscJ